MSDQLKLAGIELTQGYGAEQMAVKPDLWVIGNAVSRGNPCLKPFLTLAPPTPRARSGCAKTFFRGGT